MAAGKFNASKVKLRIGVPPVSPATTISVWKGMSEETSCTFDISIDEIPVTSKYNDGFDEALPGLIKGTLSGECIVNNRVAANMYTSADLLGMALARDRRTLRIGSQDEDDPEEQFEGFFTKFSKTLEMEAAGKYSFEIKMTTRPVPVP